MFSFTTPRLPDERLVRVVENAELSELPAEFLDAFREARFPALLIGQRDDADLAAFASVLEKKNALLVLPEVIAGVEGSLRMKVFDALDERKADDRPLMPDLIIQAGGNFIHKRFKERLRREDCRIVRVGEEMDWADTFERAEMIIKTSPVSFLRQLAAADITEKTAVRAAKTLYDRWVTAFTERLVLSFEDSLCGLHLFRVLYSSLLRESQPFSLHLGNSTAVRRAASVIPSGRFPVFCNRGTNGIEGSLSAAVGYALGRTEEKTIVVLGDLSFFYDANGLWNVRLPRGLRVLVMNNGRGSIFDGLEGLSASPARRDLIAAGGQHYSACGIAETFGLDYFAVRSEEDLQETIADWLNDTDKPALLEVFIED